MAFVSGESLQPPALWSADLPNRGIQLRDPYDLSPLPPSDDVGRARILRDPESKRNLVTLREEIGRMAGNASVGVLLADPATAEGLGSQEDLEGAFSAFDTIGFSIRRSVYRERFQKDAGVDSYVERLTETAKKLGRRVFNFDPRPENGVWDAAADELRVAEAALEAYDFDDEASFMAADMVFCDMVEGDALGRIGKARRKLYKDAPDQPQQSMLLVPPFEHRNLAGLFGGQSLAGVDLKWAGTVIAHDGIAQRPDFIIYPESIQEGNIDPRMLTD